MYIDKLVKKELIILIVFVFAIVTIFIGSSYAYFMSIDKGEDNTINIGDLEVTFCIDETCKKDYANFGQVIGTKNVNGQSVIENIYPYTSNTEALKSDPYIFNIKNTGTLKSFLTIKLKEDIDYKPINDIEEYKSLTELYSNNIKVGISDCSKNIDRENVIINTYGNLEDNIILKDDILLSGEDKTYCLWTWLDENTPNEVQNTYFVANLDFNAEYKPVEVIEDENVENE